MSSTPPFVVVTINSPLAFLLNPYTSAELALPGWNAPAELL